MTPTDTAGAGCAECERLQVQRERAAWSAGNLGDATSMDTLVASERAYTTHRETHRGAA